MKTLIMVSSLLYFAYVQAKNIWIGEWVASDQWQSEFLISINDDGTASSNYGSGETGSWKFIDGNLKIIWDSGKTDYFFSGVMGFQRIRKNKNESYTSGLKRLSD
tara:strand:- start:2069 stop:2383 length:315 start_codon:yes stop_codon:yes gene_type:complete